MNKKNLHNNPDKLIQLKVKPIYFKNNYWLLVKGEKDLKPLFYSNTNLRNMRQSIPEWTK